MITDYTTFRLEREFYINEADSELQKKYQKFFKNKLQQHDVESPAELDKDGKKKFFSEIKDEWKMKAKAEGYDELYNYSLDGMNEYESEDDVDDYDFDDYDDTEDEYYEDSDEEIDESYLAYHAYTTASIIEDLYEKLSENTYTYDEIFEYVNESIINSDANGDYSLDLDNALSYFNNLFEFDGENYSANLDISESLDDSDLNTYIQNNWLYYIS